MASKTIGIIGGGEWGAKIVRAAKAISARAILLGKSAHEWETDFFRLAEQCDVLTYDLSSSAHSVADKLEDEGFPVLPSAETRRMIKDQFLQNEALKKFGIPVPDYVEINSAESLANFISEFRFPLTLKRKINSEDGAGKITLQTMNDLAALLSTHILDADLKDKKYMLEKQFPSILERTVIVARNRSGETNSKILNESAGGGKVVEHAKRVAVMAVESLNGIGVFEVKMFACSESADFVNQIVYCPPTTDMSAHVRALLDLPVAEPDTVPMETN